MSSHRSWRHALAGLCLSPGLLLSAGVLGADTPAKNFADHTSVVVIEVPVEVTVDGKAVRGLKKSDFELSVDGDLVTIDTFEEIDLGDAAQAPRLTLEGGGLNQLPAAASRRRLLFLFDLSNNSVAAITKARTSAEEVLAKLAPTDLVGVATYSRAKGFSLDLHYSPDRRQVAAALASLGNGQPIHRRDPLGMLVEGSLVEKGQELMSEYVEIKGVPGGDAGGMISPSDSKNLQIMLERANLDAKESDSVTAYRQMEQLGEVCRTIDGRKHVVYFSAGIEDDLLAGTTDNDRRTELSRTANEGGAIWQIDSEEYFGSSRVAKSIESLIDVLRRGECVLHTIDTSGLRAGRVGHEKSGESGLHALADGTGGTYLENFNNFELAVEEMLDRTRYSYLLSFRSPDLPSNGKFHKIKVAIDNVAGRPRLTHRPGFYAPDAKKPPTQLQQVVELGARLFDDRRPGELSLRGAAWPWVASERAPLRHVPLVVEMDAPADLTAPTPIDIMVYAFDADSNARDVIAQRFAYDPKSGAAGLKVMLPMLLPPGELLLRILVREGAGGRTGLLVLPVSVPREVRALLVPEELGLWQISRGNRPDVAAATSHPFAFGEAFFSPSLVARVTTPGKMPLVAIGIAGGEALLLDGRLQKLGKVALGGEKHGKNADGIDRRAVKAELPALAPGDYFLEIDAMRIHFQVVAQPPTSRLVDLTAP